VLTSDLERAVARELHRRAQDSPTDVQSLLLPAGGSAPTRTNRPFLLSVAAAAVVFAVVAASALLVANHGTGVRRPGSSGARPPAAAQPATDVQTVAYHSLQVTVPARWPLNATVCGTPRTDTVVLLDGPVPLCAAQPSHKPMTVVYLGPLEAGVGRQWASVATSRVSIDGHKARLGSGVPPGALSTVTVLAVPDADAFVAVTAPTATDREAILATVHVVTTDGHGCSTVTPPNGVLADTQRTRTVLSAVLVPAGPSSASVCSYDKRWLYFGASVDGARLAKLVAGLDALPVGTSAPGPGYHATAAACREDAQRGYVVTFRYPVSTAVRVRIQVGGCSGLGAANGYRHTQLRGAVVDMLLSIAPYDGPLPGPGDLR